MDSSLRFLDQRGQAVHWCVRELMDVAKQPGLAVESSSRLNALAKQMDDALHFSSSANHERTVQANEPLLFPLSPPRIQFSHRVDHTRFQPAAADIEALCRREPSPKAALQPRAESDHGLHSSEISTRDLGRVEDEPGNSSLLVKLHAIMMRRKDAISGWKVVSEKPNAQKVAIGANGRPRVLVKRFSKWIKTKTAIWDQMKCAKQWTP